MDAKDLQGDPVLGERNDRSSSYPHGGAANQCSETNKSFHGVSSSTMPKGGTQAIRPCAVIGPDRIISQQIPNVDTYSKKLQTEGWLYNDNGYRKPPNYPQKIGDHQNPTRNISPRQTFQENMPRIMVPPRLNITKMSDGPSNFITDRNILINKNVKLNVPTEPKYCDVPYTVNPLTNEIRHSARNPELCVNNVNPMLMRNPAHVWPSSSNPQTRPPRPYGPSDLYCYPEYPPTSRPSGRSLRTIPEEQSPYGDPYNRGANVRFEPYPSSKDRYPHTRYEYISNYSNPYHPSNFPPHKYGLQKGFAPNPYIGYPQVQFKYLESRLPENHIDYQRPNQPPGFNMPYHPQNHPPSYTAAGNCLPNKIYAYPENVNKATHLNKVSYDNPSKMNMECDSSQIKTYPNPDNYYINEMTRSQHVKGPMIMPNYPPVNIHAISQSPNHFWKENPSLKSYDYSPHYKNMEPNNNNVNYAYSKVAPIYTSNIISPSDSNTSNDTVQTIGISQDDCGYVSQSSTASGKSIEHGNRFYNHDIYRRFDYLYRPLRGSSPMSSRQHLNNTSKNSENKEKKDIDVRRFLQEWSEGDDECNETNNSNKESITIPIQNELPKSLENASKQEQLYVLGLVNVPSEELGKYEHIQKVSKLPENIKGYSNLELLNQFEEVTGSSSVISNKPMSMHDLQKPKKTSIQNIDPNMFIRPLSPLDVEAKISQSVIHKEVGCNFEIKPCSPEMLNVEIAAPVQSLLGERKIEKITNPHIVLKPSMLQIRDSNGNFRVGNSQKSVQVAIPSCKMIDTPYLSEVSDNVKSSYTLHDLESNSGVCLASLPRLDTDIELNFPEVNQQFIDANKGDSVVNSSAIVPNLQTKNSHISIEYSIRKDITTNVLSCKNVKNKEDTNIMSPVQDTEKNISKLSKFRKNKTNNKIFLEGINDYKSDLQVQRTNSVIIKNPENIDKNINADESNRSLNTLQMSSESHQNLNKQMKIEQTSVIPINLSNEQKINSDVNDFGYEDSAIIQFNNDDINKCLNNNNVAINLSLNSTEFNNFNTLNDSNKAVINYVNNEVTMSDKTIEVQQISTSNKSLSSKESIFSVPKLEDLDFAFCEENCTVSNNKVTEMCNNDINKNTKSNGIDSETRAQFHVDPDVIKQKVLDVVHDLTVQKIREKEGIKSNEPFFLETKVNNISVLTNSSQIKHKVPSLDIVSVTKDSREHLTDNIHDYNIIIDTKNDEIPVCSEIDEITKTIEFKINQVHNCDINPLIEDSGEHIGDFKITTDTKKDDVYHEIEETDECDDYKNKEDISSKQSVHNEEHTHIILSLNETKDDNQNTIVSKTTSCHFYEPNDNVKLSETLNIDISLHENSMDKIESNSKFISQALSNHVILNRPEHVEKLHCNTVSDCTTNKCSNQEYKEVDTTEDKIENELYDLKKFSEQDSCNSSVHVNELKRESIEENLLIVNDKHQELNNVVSKNILNPEENIKSNCELEKNNHDSISKCNLLQTLNSNIVNDVTQINNNINNHDRSEQLENEIVFNDDISSDECSSSAVGTIDTEININLKKTINKSTILKTSFSCNNKLENTENEVANINNLDTDSNLQHGVESDEYYISELNIIKIDIKHNNNIKYRISGLKKELFSPRFQKLFNATGLCGTNMIKSFKNKKDSKDNHLEDSKHNNKIHSEACTSRTDDSDDLENNLSCENYKNNLAVLCFEDECIDNTDLLKNDYSINNEIKSSLNSIDNAFCSEIKAYDSKVVDRFEENITVKENSLNSNVTDNLQNAETKELSDTKSENYKSIIQLTNICSKNDNIKESINTHCQTQNINCSEEKHKNIERISNIFTFNKLPNRKLKRSLSESSLYTYSNKHHQFNNLFTESSVQFIDPDNVKENEPLAWCKKRKKHEYRHPSIVYPDVIQNCNVLQYSRRNSTSSICNDEVALCIYIDNDCIMNEENTTILENSIDEPDFEVEEQEENYLAKIDDNQNHCIHEENLIDNPKLDIKNYNNSPESTYENLEENEVWVDDVACVETVVSEYIIENSCSDSTESEILSTNSKNDVEYFNDHKDVIREGLNVNIHSAKIKGIYGNNMNDDNIKLVDALYNTPQMNVNNKLTKRESHNIDFTQSFVEYDINTSLQKVLSDFHNNVVTSYEPICNVQSLSPSKYPNDSLDLIDENHSSDDNIRQQFINDLNEQPVSVVNNDTVTRENTEISFTPIANCLQSSDNLKMNVTQDDTVHSCESSNGEIITNLEKKKDICNSNASSPEVTSTTEEKKSSILLKITNYNGSRVSIVEGKSSQTEICEKKLRCKFTEVNRYVHSQNSTVMPLITKAAKKYIPPLENYHDLKIKLPLPQKSLLKLKELKSAKGKPKITKDQNMKDSTKQSSKFTIKKIKPNFEDVLKSIDEVQYKLHKDKHKKIKKIIPKVVIKKNENGSHYASTSKMEFNPDLTGRKWQPWVFLEKINFIDKMALRNKTKAIFCHKRKMFVLAEKFQKYSKCYKDIVLYPPIADNPSKSSLKYTIRLKHSY